VAVGEAGQRFGSCNAPGPIRGFRPAGKRLDRNVIEVPPPSWVCGPSGCHTERLVCQKVRRCQGSFLSQSQSPASAPTRNP